MEKNMNFAIEVDEASKNIKSLALEQGTKSRHQRGNLCIMQGATKRGKILDIVWGNRHGCESLRVHDHDVTKNMKRYWPDEKL